MLRIHLEFYAVPWRSSLTSRGQSRIYGVWAPLVDQLITQASSDIFANFLSADEFPFFSFKFFKLMFSFIGEVFQCTIKVGYFYGFFIFMQSKRDDDDW